MPLGRATPALSADDRAAIGEVVAGIGLDADVHESDRLLDRFTPRVSSDYTSLFGGTPLVQDRDALVASWRGFLPGFDATQHLIAVAAIRLDDPDHTTATSNVRATHRIGRKLRVVGGTYTHVLARSAEAWRVTSMCFSLAYEEGIAV